MFTLMVILAVASLLSAILVLMNKCPVAVPLILLSVIACLQVIPLK